MIPHSKPTVGDEEARAIVDCLESTCLTRGPRVAKLEHRISTDFHYKHAFAVSKGSLAFTLVLKALFKSGHARIALPSYLCRSVYDAICLANCEPIVLDIDADSLSISLQDTIAATPDAVIIPHMFGIRAPVEAFLNHGFIVIEDCAQRVPPPARMADEPKAHFKVLSFEATKLLTSGEGGMLLCHDSTHTESIRDLIEAPSTFNKMALQFLFTDIQASMALVQWTKLAQFLQKRKAIGDIYRRELENRDLGRYIHPSMHTEDTYPFRFVLTVDDVSGLIDHMARSNVICRRPVSPFGLHTLFGIEGNFENTEKAMECNVSLPIYPSLTKAEIQTVLTGVIGYLRAGNPRQ